MQTGIVDQGLTLSGGTISFREDVKTRCFCLKSECPWMKQLMITFRQNPYFSVTRNKQINTLIEACPATKGNIFMLLDGDSTAYEPISLLKKIKQERPETQVILFTRHLSQIQFYGYILAGIDGAVSKEHDPREVKKMVTPASKREKPVFTKVQ